MWILTHFAPTHPTALRIVNYKKIDAVPQLTGGQKVYTIKKR